MSHSTRYRAEQLLAGCAAAAVWSLTAGFTIFAAIPVYGPLTAEFRWQPLALASAAAASLGLTATLVVRFATPKVGASTRGLCASSALLSGGVLLLLLPNLTHLWQLCGALLLLGVARAGLALGAWRELSALLGRRAGAVLLAAATLVGLALFTPPISDLIYRNSWREGVAAAGGAMLLFAAPIAYVLLPGSV